MRSGGEGPSAHSPTEFDDRENIVSLMAHQFVISLLVTSLTIVHASLGALNMQLT